MESPYGAPVHHMDSSRPSIGFPLGTALLLIVIFSLSGVFSCCYHWEKLRSLRRSFSGDEEVDAHGVVAPTKPKTFQMGPNIEKHQSLPVIMPGDKIAKFIALPCPCEPPRPENIIVEVQMPPKPRTRSPPIAVPLY